MTDAEIREMIARGTTTRPEQLQVLYNDGEVALVKRPGASVGRVGFRSWVSAYVERFDLTAATSRGACSGDRVWDCARDRQGPLTRRRLHDLVVGLGLDPAFLVEEDRP